MPRACFRVVVAASCCSMDSRYCLYHVEISSASTPLGCCIRQSTDSPIACALGADIADQIGCLAYQCAEFSEHDTSAGAVFVHAVIKTLYLCRDGYTTGAMQKIMRIASDVIDKAKVSAAQAVPAIKPAAQAAAPVVAQEVLAPAGVVKPSKPVVVGGVRAMRHYMTDGNVKVKVRYHASTDYKTGQPVVWVHQQEYGYELFSMLGDVCRNETDTQTDYFDKTSAKLTPAHPMYAECLKRAQENDAAWKERQAKRRTR